LSERFAKLASLFHVFFVIGVFTFGGGYAMLPAIRLQLVDNHHWLEEDEFLDGVGLAQTCPGPLAVNVAAYSGRRIAGVAGGIVASIAVTLPAFLVMLAVASLLMRGGDDHWLQAAFRGARPAVAALLVYATVGLVRRVLRNLPSRIVAGLSLAGLVLLRFHPLVVIGLAGAYGYARMARYARRRARSY